MTKKVKSTDNIIWTRVTRPDGTYGYIRTRDNRPVDFNENTGYFNVYDKPDTKSSYRKSYKNIEAKVQTNTPIVNLNEVTVNYTRPKGIQRTPDDHAAYLAQQKDIDKRVNQTAPNVTDFVELGVKPLNLISPSHYIGVIRNYNKDEPIVTQLFDDNAGLFGKEYAEKHPIITTLGNMAFDGAVGGGLLKLNQLQRSLNARYTDKINRVENIRNYLKGDYAKEIQNNNYKKSYIVTPPSKAEKLTFRQLYKTKVYRRPISNSIVNNPRTRKLLTDNPEYHQFLDEVAKDSEHILDPYDQNLVSAFIDRQKTSIRGVHAPTKEKAIQYLTETESNRLLTGGDRLKTHGGLYTSNTTGVADRFKNPMTGVEDGYVAVLRDNYVNDTSLPIEKQLYNLRRQSIFGANSSPLGGTPYYNSYLGQARDRAKYIEANYVGRANDGSGYERAYYPRKVTLREFLDGTRLKDRPVSIIELKHYPNQVNQRGRWASDIIPKLNNNLFIGKQLNPTTDFIEHARVFLKGTPEFSIAKFRELNGPHDLNYKNINNRLNWLESRYNNKKYNLNKVNTIKKAIIRGSGVVAPTSLLLDASYKSSAMKKRAKIEKGRHENKNNNKDINKTWADNITKYIGAPQWFAEMTNPEIQISGYYTQK